MSSLPPPPPGPEEQSFIDSPPPPGSEHVNDVLERRKKFSWKSFGGDGFLVSVAFHVLLGILALFYVVSRFKAPVQKTDPEVFATGAGGGANGDKPKAFEQKLQTKQMNVKMPTRITSKSSSSISLPDTPQTNTASFASGLTSGGMSKGSGGGTGGGEGTGIGIGKGGGKNFVSLFGARGNNLPGLPGVFYDCKQYADGRPSPFENADGNDGYIDKVLRPFVKNWEDAIFKRYFKAPESLVASQIFIPSMDANEAPKAYNVQDKVKPSRWVAHYKGIVTAPATGKFRFVVFGDDTLAVRWNKKMVADGGWTVLGFPGHLSNYNFKVTETTKNPPPGITPDSYKGAFAPPFRCGTWINVQKGTDYPMEVIISEIPGGKSSSYMMMEQADPEHTSKSDGKIFLFRMTADPLPEGIRQDTGLEVDMTGKGLIWKARGDKANAVR